MLIPSHDPSTVRRTAPGMQGLGRLPLRGLGALASRLYVYLSGFAAVFLLAATMTPARFGEYSLYQSVLEMALVVATLGSSLLFSRQAAAGMLRVRRGDLQRTLALGLPLTTLLAAALLAAQRLPVPGWPFALIVCTLGVFAFNTLRLAYDRGQGHAGLLNLEPGIRATFLVLCVGAAAVLCGSSGEGGGLGVPSLLAVNLLGMLLVTAAVVPSSRPGGPPRGRAALALATQGGATVYSLLMFLLRKSDLQIVALLMPLGYVGAFKIAFLLAEAPSQFVQAFLYTRTPAMLQADAQTLEASAFPLARQSFLLGCGLFAMLAALITLAAPLLHVGREAVGIFLCLAPYFLLRTYTVHHEMLLALRTPVASLGRWALAEVAVRLLSYGAVALLFPGRPHYVFFLACGTDLALYEVRMRLAFGIFPITRLTRGAWQRLR
ncbi:polysaccharide biosynthesis protein [Xylophilus sp.]|uniref:polysaccharide biosynthesis protein n=1 Tax=Xylophilus sp. TaxID=2653893 RepID=UPI0013B74D51|nr:polysaccharide biosynthesis protein [Xylophilus sp.]KAF1048068.1 MAG: hypothetical protein GAK38_01539 [Xylophilus sp.]